MLSKAEEACYRELLAKSQTGVLIKHDDVKPFFTDEQFARFSGLALNFWLEIEAEYEKAYHGGVAPDAAVGYRERLRTVRNQYESMKNRLPKLEAQLQALLRRVKAHEDYLARAKQDMWGCYDELSDQTKALWFEPGTEKDGWPPLVYNEPSPNAICAAIGKEQPEARALRVVLEELLG